MLTLQLREGKPPWITLPAFWRALEQGSGVGTQKESDAARSQWLLPLVLLQSGSWKLQARMKSKWNKVYEHRVTQLTNACPSQDRFTTYGITNFTWVFTLPPVSLQTFPCEGIGKTEINTCAFAQHTLFPLQGNVLSMENGAGISTLQLCSPTPGSFVQLMHRFCWCHNLTNKNTSPLEAKYSTGTMRREALEVETNQGEWMKETGQT